MLDIVYAYAQMPPVFFFVLFDFVQAYAQMPHMSFVVFGIVSKPMPRCRRRFLFCLIVYNPMHRCR